MGLNDAAQGEFPVIVIGGGPVGVGIALELLLHGQRALVSERHERGEERQCRSNLTNVRSMELFRRWGIVRTAEK